MLPDSIIILDINKDGRVDIIYKPYSLGFQEYLDLIIKFER